MQSLSHKGPKEASLGLYQPLILSLGPKGPPMGHNEKTSSNAPHPFPVVMGFMSN